MPATLETLQAEVMRLSPADRASLLDRLIVSPAADDGAEARGTRWPTRVSKLCWRARLRLDRWELRSPGFRRVFRGEAGVDGITLRFSPLTTAELQIGALRNR
jgi:hypothetical protein